MPCIIYTRKQAGFPSKTDRFDMKNGSKGKRFHFKMEKVDMEFCFLKWYYKY